MATINFTATISGSCDLDADLEEVVGEYLSNSLGSDLQIEDITDVELES